MNRLKRGSWIAVVACLTAGFLGQAALAHGHGGGHGGGGHGGGHGGGGHGGGGHMGGGHHGGGGYHHGGGGYGGGYGGYYGGYSGIGLYGLGGYGGYGYRSGYGYGYNQPYYYNQQYYNQSVQYYATPVTTTNAIPAPDGGEIVLFVPGDAANGIQYTLNGQAFSMKPGDSQRLVNDRVWTIEFPTTPGGQLGLRYTLISAKYKFKPSGSGMGLFQTQDSPTPVTAAPVPAPVPNPPK
jgi:hypothetical protein